MGTWLGRSLCVCAALGILSGLPALADSFDPFAPCNSSFTVCDIYEGVPSFLPFLAIAGDVLLIDGDGQVSDVVHFFNDIVDTGGGTGLGDVVFQFSNPDDPDPFPLSVNAAVMLEGPPGPNGLEETIFFGNGTEYDIFGGPPPAAVPEPRTALLLASGLACVLIYKRARLVRPRKRVYPHS